MTTKQSDKMEYFARGSLNILFLLLFAWNSDGFLCETSDENISCACIAVIDAKDSTGPDNKTSIKGGDGKITYFKLQATFNLTDARLAFGSKITIRNCMNLTWFMVAYDQDALKKTVIIQNTANLTIKVPRNFTGWQDSLHFKPDNVANVFVEFYDLEELDEVTDTITEALEATTPRPPDDGYADATVALSIVLVVVVMLWACYAVHNRM